MVYPLRLYRRFCLRIGFVLEPRQSPAPQGIAAIHRAQWARSCVRTCPRRCTRNRTHPAFYPPINHKKCTTYPQIYPQVCGFFHIFPVTTASGSSISPPPFVRNFSATKPCRPPNACRRNAGNTPTSCLPGKTGNTSIPLNFPRTFAISAANWASRPPSICCATIWPAV